MSSVFDVRNLRLPERSRTTMIAGALLLALLAAAAFGGVQLYRKLNSNSVVAYFPQTDALYPGDAVQIMGVRVGAIDKIEPAGDKMKVTLHYDNKYKVPAEAHAIILNPTLVASRTIQLEPPYRGVRRWPTRPSSPRSAPRSRSSGTPCATTSPTSSTSWARPRHSPRDRSARRSSPSPTASPARASRSTPRSTTCPTR